MCAGGCASACGCPPGWADTVPSMTREPAPRVGDLAPDFTLPDAEGTPVRLSDVLKQKVVVLYFYPRDDTSGCTVESCAFRDKYPDFDLARSEVLGISRDALASHVRFAAKHRLPFPLLSDPDGAVHALYGVRSRLAGLLRDRTTFVIDRTGIVRLAYSSRTDFTGHVRAALKVVRKLVWVKGEHGSA